VGSKFFRFELLTAVFLKIEVFWEIAVCSLAVCSYQCCRGAWACCLHLQDHFFYPENGGSRLLWNDSSYLPIDTASYPRRLESWSNFCLFYIRFPLQYSRDLHSSVILYSVGW